MNVSFRGLIAAAFTAVLLFGCAADKLHREGLQEIGRGNYEVGVQDLAQAVARDPNNMTYKLDLAARRDAAIQSLIGIADAMRGRGELDQATVTYRRVLSIDSANQRALHGLEGVEADRRHAAAVADAAKDFERKDYDAADQKLRAVLNEDSGFSAALALNEKIKVARGPTTVAPRLKSRNNANVTLQFRDAPTKMVFEVLARQTGINFILDKDVKSDGKTTIFVQEVPIDEAIDLVLDQNNLARQILSSNMVLIYPNTPAKQKDYEEQIVHTFYLTNAVPKDVEGMLKSMLGAKNLFVDERTSAVAMRDSPEAVRMAEKLVASIDVPEPEVLISVEVLEIARSRLLDLGITLPGSITASATSVAGAASSAGAGGLVLSDLSHQNSNTIAISSVSATLNALQTVGNTNTLASPRLRARNKEKAKILIGSRVPVITSSTALLSSGTASSSSGQYLDVGLTLEVQPTVYLDGDVAIKIGLEVSSITNTVVVAGTQAYTIGTRNANTLIRLKDGETQILAGLIQDSDTRNAAGIPGLSQIPIVGRLFGSNNTDREKSEIVLSITPHIIRTQTRPESDSTEFWYGTETRARSSPFGSASFDSGPAGAAAAPGGASGGSAPAAASGPGIPTVGPRPSVSQPVVVTPPTTGTPAPAPPAPAGPPPHPTVTVDGPGEIAVGQEFDVTVHMATDIGISRLRGQVRFDSSALQLVSGTAGEIVRSSAGSPSVDSKGGGAQLDVVAGDDPVQ